ncbi:MAG TPA: hypothetical protein VH643_21615 [Gemmataceae bacterium]
MILPLAFGQAPAQSIHGERLWAKFAALQRIADFFGLLTVFYQTIVSPPEFTIEQTQFGLHLLGETVRPD